MEKISSKRRGKRFTTVLIPNYVSRDTSFLRFLNRLLSIISELKLFLCEKHLNQTILGLLKNLEAIKPPKSILMHFKKKSKSLDTVAAKILQMTHIRHHILSSKRANIINGEYGAVSGRSLLTEGLEPLG